MSTLDRELEDLPPEMRWQTWLGRIEAVLFASATPVSRAALARVVGQDVSVEMLIAELAEALRGRAVEVARVGEGWMLRTRAGYAEAVQEAADLGAPPLALRETEAAVLCAIAQHQPVTRAALADLFGREVSRDLLGRLHAAGLIATGPRAPRRGAPLTYVTTEQFLATFGLEGLWEVGAFGEVMMPDGPQVVEGSDDAL